MYIILSCNVKLGNKGGSTALGSSNSFVYLVLRKSCFDCYTCFFDEQESDDFLAIWSSDQENAKCVMLHCELKSVISVQLRFSIIYIKDHSKSIYSHKNSIHRSI